MKRRVPLIPQEVMKSIDSEVVSLVIYDEYWMI